MNWKHWTALLFVAAFGIFLSRPQQQKALEQRPTQPAPVIETRTPTPIEPSRPNPSQEALPQKPNPATKAPEQKKTKSLVLPYTIEDGLIVVMNDIVIGAPANENYEDQGLVEVPQIEKWPTNQIPFHIQPDLRNPERVLEAIEMFRESGFQLVPLTTQKDAIVFVNGTGACKSYVGRVGGHQPIWLSDSCGASEVAHEIMHALGFIHEQNRIDRDRSIAVNLEEVQDSARINFEKLPENFMLASGLSDFDFESIMIYPDHLFAKGSTPTMAPRLPNRRIDPSRTLSPQDLERLRILARGN